MPITEPRDRLRLQIGDTGSPALFTDDELDTLLAERDGEILTTAADACDILATRFATNYDFEWQGSQTARGKFNRSQVAKMFADRAKALRDRADDEADFEIAELGVTEFARRELRGL